MAENTNDLPKEPEGKVVEETSKEVSSEAEPENAPKEAVKPEKKKSKLTSWAIAAIVAGGVIILGGAATGVYFLVRSLWVNGEGSEEETLTWEELEEEVTNTDVEVNVHKAGSCGDLNTIARSYSEKQGYRYDSVAEQEAMEECDGCGDEGGYGDDGGYSVTNVQVEGIDEDDVVKTDGTYIYYVDTYDGNIYVSKANPAASLAVVSTIDSDYADFSGIYIYKNYLVGIGGGIYSGYWGEDEAPADVSDWYGYGSTVMEVWDITNKSVPSLVKGWIFDGYSNGSRLVDGDLYLVMNTYRYYDYGIDKISIPEMMAYGEEAEPMCGCTDVSIPDDPWSDSFVEVAGLDLDNLDDGIKAEVVYGIGNTVYMSKEHLYIAGTYYDYLETQSEGLWDSLGNWLWPSDNYTERTIVSKLDFSGGAVSYVADGQIPGSLLNQFSMDEYEDNLRVAVTKDNWTDHTSNAVYVLDDELNRIGSVTGLAEGESIYAVRFMEDTGYVVTYERMDPLFVLDLADPEAPELMGELEIPGYSDYLHPWGDHYLIGFGMSTSDRGDWVQTDGLKIALFDVEDPTDPQEVSTIEIGGAGSSSEILYNHRALLANPSQGWFAIPVYEYSRDNGIIEYDPDNAPAWNVTEFQGLYVFTVDMDAETLALKGKITHHQAADFASNCYSEPYTCGYHRWERDIVRGVYIGNVMYALSYESIGAYKVSNLEEIKKVPFGIEVIDYEDYTTWE